MKRRAAFVATLPLAVAFAFVASGSARFGEASPPVTIPPPKRTMGRVRGRG